MSESSPREEAAALARAFARHLEHLQTYRGLAYVGAGAMPRSDLAEDATAVEQASERSADTPERAHAKAPIEAPVESSPLPSSAPAPAQSRPAAQARPTSSPRPAAGPRPTPTAQAPAQAKSGKADKARDWSGARKLEFLRNHIGDCRRCPLCETRNSIVFGVGNPEADLMFVGEAPGAQEDRRGEPFVGPAGQRLTHWIRWLGFSREQVYIANVIKCRPPGNRDPQRFEIDRCSPFLHAQVRAIEPKVIVALGRFAGCLLLGQQRKMYEMRGQLHRYREPKTQAEFPLVVTYHPSYVIRREREGPRGSQTNRGGAIKSEDQKVLDDLARAGSLLHGPR